MKATLGNLAITGDSGYGSVGIGTDTPGSYLASTGLVIKNATRPELSMVSTNTALETNSHQIRFFNASAPADYEIARISVGVGEGQKNRGTFDFLVNNGGALSSAMHISRTSQVGIGTDVPGRLLDLRTNTTSVDPLLLIRQIGTGDAAMSFQTSTDPYGFTIGVDGSDADKFKIGTGATSVSAATKFTIDTTGNVGIGTSSPLSLDGNAAPGLTVSSNGPYILLQDANNSDKVRYISNNTGAFQFGIVGDNGISGKTEHMRITTGGNVGIGDDNPASKFTVDTAPNGNVPVAHIKQNAATNAPTLFIEQTGEGGNSNVNQGLLIKVDGNNGGYGNIIRAIGTNSNINGGTDVEAFIVKNDGKVGIGTTSPKSILDLGTSSQGRRLTFTNYSNLTSEYSNASLWLSSNFYPNPGATGYKVGATGNFGASAVRVHGTGGGSNSGIIQFYTDVNSSKTADAAFTPTERMRLGATGALELGYGGAARQQADSQAFSIITPATGGGQGLAFKRLDSNNDQGLGEISWSNNTQDGQANIRVKTAGAVNSTDMHFDVNNAGTLVTAMSIDGSAGGNVGIGTDTPGASRLKVYNSTVTGNTHLHIHNDKTGDAAVLRLEGKRTSANDTAQLLFANNGNVVARIDAVSGGDDGELRFFTSASGTGNNTVEAMSISAAGNTLFSGNINSSSSTLNGTVYAPTRGTTTHPGSASSTVYNIYNKSRVSGKLNLPFQVYFPNGTSNLAVRLYTTLSSLWFSGEVLIGSTYSNASATGLNRYSFSHNMNSSTNYGSALTQTETMGAVSSHFTFASHGWDATEGAHYFEFRHITSSGNTMHVQFQGHGSVDAYASSTWYYKHLTY